MNYKSNIELWEERISAFRTSGLTQMQWCHENNVKLSTLRYWIRKLNDRTQASNGTKWFQLDVKEDTPTLTEGSSITVKVGNYSILVNDNFNRSVLVDVVKVLNELC